AGVGSAAGVGAPDTPASLQAGQAAPERWRCMARSSKALRPGTRLAVVDRAGQPTGETVIVASERAEDSTILVEVPDTVSGGALALLEGRGELPLPPYI